MRLSFTRKEGLGSPRPPCNFSRERKAAAGNRDDERLDRDHQRCVMLDVLVVCSTAHCKGAGPALGPRDAAYQGWAGPLGHEP